MGALKATHRRAVVHECVHLRVCLCALATVTLVSLQRCVLTSMCCCTFMCLHRCFDLASPKSTGLNFEHTQMLCKAIVRQWKESFLSTYRSMGSHSIRKSETISTKLMTPYWGAGKHWPKGRMVAGGGARKSVETGWDISLTACIMSAPHVFIVSQNKWHNLLRAWYSRVLTTSPLLALFQQVLKLTHLSLLPFLLFFWV